MKSFRQAVKWNVLAMVAAFLVAGCNGIGNKTETVTTTQTVIYQGEVPVFVLNHEGTQYVSVGEASQELLIERGLLRLETGQVAKQP